MPDSGLQAPYLDPSQYPDYLDAQRKSQVASLLLNSLQQGSPTPAGWDSMKVVPKRGFLQNVAPLVTALMAGKANQSAQEAQRNYFQGLYGGNTSGAPQQTSSQPLSLAPPAADPNEQSVQPLIQRNPGQSFQQTLQGAQPSGQRQAPTRNPMLLTGDPRTSQMLLGLMGQSEYGKALAGQYAPTEMEKMLRAAGIDPNSPQGQAALQQAVGKANYIAPIEQRPGAIERNPLTNAVIGQNPAAPQGAVNFYDPQGNLTGQGMVPGATSAIAQSAGASTGGKEANTPHYEPDPFHPGQFIVSYPPTPPALAGTPRATQTPPVPRGTTSNTPTGTAADLEGQKEGAKAGAAYASELSKNATGATEVRRSLAELKNLANQAGPSGLNEGKMKLGTYMIAAGMSPESVGQFLGVDVGALQAAQKQTATLAVNTIHSMTSRGTNFDLDTFMRNNPNMNMADPAAFGRVVDYMDNKAKQEVAKQKDFAEWKKGHTPDEWETGHTAHWLDLQNQNIDAGKSNSRPPISSFWRQ